MNLRKFLENMAAKLKCFCFIQCCVTIPEGQQSVFPKVPKNFYNSTEKDSDAERKEFLQDIRNYHQALQRSLIAGESEPLLGRHRRSNSCPSRVDMYEHHQEQYPSDLSRIEKSNPYENAWS